VTPTVTATGTPTLTVTPIPTGAVIFQASAVTFAFLPNPITIQVGTTVIWTNGDTATPHTVTADDGSFDSGNLIPGSGFQVTFATPGTYAYRCQYHASLGMTGTINVLSQVPAPMSSRVYLPIVFSNARGP
jgi:plastocyanin